MRILFAGTDDIAVPSLERLIAEKNVVAVLTAADQPKGRGKTLTPSPIKVAALEHNIPVLDFQALRSEEREIIRSYKPDLLVTFAYGKIFGPKFLQLFPLGGINVHPSLLPQLRGPSPISTAILNGFDVTGITIQKIELEIDSGDILKQIKMDNILQETTESLNKRVAQLAPDLLHQVVNEYETGTFKLVRQNSDEATFTKMIQKEDGRIDWNESSFTINCKVRAYNPWPSAFTVWQEKWLKIFSTETADIDFELKPGEVKLGKKQIYVGTGDGALSILELQLQSKKRLNATQFINGNRQIDGVILGEN